MAVNQSFPSPVRRWRADLRLWFFVAVSLVVLAVLANSEGINLPT